MRWTTTSRGSARRAQAEPRATASQKKAVNDKIKAFRKLLEQTYDEASVKLFEYIRPITKPVREISLAWLQDLEKSIDDAYPQVLKDYEKVQAAKRENPGAAARINMLPEDQRDKIAARIAAMGKPEPKRTNKIISWGLALIIVFFAALGGNSSKDGEKSTAAGQASASAELTDRLTVLGDQEIDLAAADAVLT